VQTSTRNMTGFPNPYEEKRLPSPGEVEVRHASLLLQVFRALRVPMPLRGDSAAVERSGILLARWWKNLTRRTSK